MKIELRKVQHNSRLSEETQCFSADIYIDGTKEGSADNRGQGGCTNIHPYELQKKLDAYAKTLPQKTARLTDTKTWTYDQTGETLIDDALAAYLTEKDLKKALAKKILFTKKGDKAANVYEFKATPAQLKALQDSDSYRTRAIEAMNAEKVLNVMPFAEALELYKGIGA